MKIIINFFLLCLVCNVFASEINLTAEEKEWIKTHPTLRVQNLTTFPPFNFNNNGEPLGYSVEYMELMAKNIGIKIKFISNKPWSEYLTMLKKGTLDVIPHIAVNEERKKFIDFTNFNHIEYTTGLAVKKGDDIKSMDDLKDKVIAVAKKTFLHTYLKDKFPKQHLLLVDSTSQAVEAVSLGHADSVIGSLPAINYYIHQNWFSNLKIVSIDDLGIPTKTKMPMGVGKDNYILKSILEKANLAMPYNAVIKLKDKWMTVKVDTSTNDIFNNEELKYLDSKKEITMCIDPDWLPLEKLENGKHTGMTSDYFAIFQKSIKIPINLVQTKTWLESLEFGKQRKCDIFSLVMPTPEREKYLEFTKPYMKVPLVIATSIDTPFVNDIPSVINKKIGIAKGYAYGELLKVKYPDMQLIEVANIKEGLERLNKGKLFGFIGTLSTIGYNIQNSYIGRLKIAGKFDETWNLGIGVRNDEKILKDIFDKVIDTLTPKQHQDILNKWISVSYQKGTDYTLVLQISFSFFILILFVLYRNRTVEKLNSKLKKANKEINEQHDMVNKYVLILTTNLDGVITSVNEAYCKTIGYKENELIGKNFYLMKNEFKDKDLSDDVWDTITSDKIWSGEITNYSKDKQVKYFNTYIEPMFDNSKKIGYRAIFEDITDKKRIEELSITDKLTGLYNRMKLDELILKKVEEYKRYKLPFSIILIDIDDFKKVNDTWGHDVGDHVLQKLSNVLKNSVRLTDIVGRWGGEEFLIICSNTNLENTFTVAKNIRTIVEEEQFDNIGNITISLGVAQFNEGDTINTIFKKADEALYEAKSSGKNSIVKK